MVVLRVANEGVFCLLVGLGVLVLRFNFFVLIVFILCFFF